MTNKVNECLLAFSFEHSNGVKSSINIEKYVDFYKEHQKIDEGLSHLKTLLSKWDIGEKTTQEIINVYNHLQKTPDEREKAAEEEKARIKEKERARVKEKYRLLKELFTWKPFVDFWNKRPSTVTDGSVLLNRDSEGINFLVFNKDEESRYGTDKETPPLVLEYAIVEYLEAVGEELSLEFNIDFDFDIVKAAEEDTKAFDLFLQKYNEKGEKVDE